VPSPLSPFDVCPSLRFGRPCATHENGRTLPVAGRLPRAQASLFLLSCSRVPEQPHLKSFTDNRSLLCRAAASHYHRIIHLHALFDRGSPYHPPRILQLSRPHRFERHYRDLSRYCLQLEYVNAFHVSPTTLTDFSRSSHCRRSLGAIRLRPVSPDSDLSSTFLEHHTYSS
jgi:hypothetical protein